MSPELSAIRDLTELWTPIVNATVTIAVCAFIGTVICALVQRHASHNDDDRTQRVSRRLARAFAAVDFATVALMAIGTLIWVTNLNARVADYLGDEPVALVTESDVRTTGQGPVCDLLEVRLVNHVDDPAIVLETDDLDTYPELYDTIVLDYNIKDIHFKDDVMHLKLNDWSYLHDDETA